MIDVIGLGAACYSSAVIYFELLVFSLLVLSMVVNDPVSGLWSLYNVSLCCAKPLLVTRDCFKCVEF